jgi:F-type H+-transporting ATPase subunit a
VGRASLLGGAQHRWLRIMSSRIRVVPVLVILGLALAIASFVGGSVGAMIAGWEAHWLLAVGPLSIHVQPGYPFSSMPVSNTILAAWLTIVLLAGVFFVGTRRMSLVPGAMQNALEYVCEIAGGFIEEMVGKEHERRMFPVIMTVFLFVLVNAWSALLPGFETIRLNGQPLLRSANTDINLPLMLAIVCVAMIEYWGFRARGFAYLKSFFDLHHLVRAAISFRHGYLRDGLVNLFYGAIYFFVGILELLGHAVRVLSFSFRLFGNMTAGVVLTTVALFLVPLVLPSVFYGLEALFGLVQAVVFAGLTAVFGYAAISSADH